MERAVLMAELKMSWNEWNSGGNCMIWSHEFVSAGSVHLTSECLVYTTASTGEHFTENLPESEDPRIKVVLHEPLERIAFSLTPYLGQEMADAVEHDARAILTFLEEEGQ